MDYKIDYDAEYWDVVGNRKFTCYSEEDARWLCNFLNNEEQQGELLPEEKEVINEWRRARLSVRNDKFGIAEERIEQAKKVIGEANDYYNDKTEIPELL